MCRVAPGVDLSKRGRGSARVSRGGGDGLPAAAARRGPQDRTPTPAMNPKLLLPAITTALLLTSGLRAQDPALAQGLLDELRVPLHEATSPDDGRVEIWAAGSDYK